MPGKPIESANNTRLVMCMIGLNALETWITFQRYQKPAAAVGLKILRRSRRQIIVCKARQ